MREDARRTPEIRHALVTSGVILVAAYCNASPAAVDDRNRALADVGRIVASELP